MVLTMWTSRQARAEIGARLKAVRVEAGLTQADLLAAMRARGYTRWGTPMSISKRELGDVAVTMEQYAAWLDVCGVTDG